MPIPNIDIHKKTGACYYLPSNTLLSEVFLYWIEIEKNNYSTTHEISQQEISLQVHSKSQPQQGHLQL